jgi:hypothetical protein
MDFINNKKKNNKNLIIIALPFYRATAKTKKYRLSHIMSPLYTPAKILGSSSELCVECSTEIPGYIIRSLTREQNRTTGTIFSWFFSKHILIKK